MSDLWLASLITETLQDGYDLALKLARVAVKMTQLDADICNLKDSVGSTLQGPEHNPHPSDHALVVADFPEL